MPNHLINSLDILFSIPVMEKLPTSVSASATNNKSASVSTNKQFIQNTSAVIIVIINNNITIKISRIPTGNWNQGESQFKNELFQYFNGYQIILLQWISLERKVKYRGGPFYIVLEEIETCCPCLCLEGVQFFVFFKVIYKYCLLKLIEPTTNTQDSLSSKHSLF